MKELSEHHFEASKADRDAALFFISPFCGTCQLAEKMLKVAVMTINPDLNVYKCRVSEWQRKVKDLRIHSVPCLVILQHGEVKDILYAFESVPKLCKVLGNFT
ncbi:thiol-disulfide isomerase/thioredoxin [Scopulibacillus darangshiensis]|uniref:Thiol-disulfide isomerase/thioredoxin n=1 Tax=Scopulibacillus darangshiensis TaxID=442528 RepID=A0A4R2NPY3_9BACL|nr:thioredoxin family protein [Scopulibacillus darangshiensis]TCP23501.1 thiol-disulfide isomerase/thioredoxin [Scopulibacillus darangshiensis]